MISLTSTLEAKDITSEDVLFYLKHVIKRIEDGENLKINLGINTSDKGTYDMNYNIQG